MRRRAVGLVAWRELEQRVRGRAFVLGTVAIVLLVFAAALIPSLAGDGDDRLEIGLVGRAPEGLAGALDAGAQALGAELEARRYPTLAAAERALGDGEVGGLVVDGRALVWKAEPDERLQAVAAGALERLFWSERAAELGLTAAQAEALLAPQPVPERRLEPAEPDENARYAAALLGIVLLGATLSLYGQAVANGVAQEKGTRVLEILLARASARELLAGKVLGVGLAGLGQLLVGAAASLVAVVAFDRIEVSGAVPAMLGWVILWFVLGYALYSVVYAALGALVSRPEDVENAQAPLGIFIMGCLFLGVYATDSPDAWLVRVASLVPVTAPFVMPVRAAGGVPAWEPALAAVLTIATTYAVVRAAAGVYEGAALRAGPRLGAGDVWRAARAARSRTR